MQLKESYMPGAQASQHAPNVDVQRDTPNREVGQLATILDALQLIIMKKWSIVSATVSMSATVDTKYWLMKNTDTEICVMSVMDNKCMYCLEEST